MLSGSISKCFIHSMTGCLPDCPVSVFAVQPAVSSDERRNVQDINVVCGLQVLVAKTCFKSRIISTK